jgi:tetratricopeptide (TPR) repeat protein
LRGSSRRAPAIRSRRSSISPWRWGRIPGASSHTAALGSFERALSLKAGYAEAWYCRGNALSALGRHEPALESYARAIALNPQHAEALNNSGTCLYELMRHAEALACFDRSLALRGDRPEVLANRGNTLRDLGRFEEAAADYEAALNLEPRLKFIPGLRLISRMHVCDWRGFESERNQLAAGIDRDEPVTDPFTALALLDSPPLQRQAARLWVREKCPANHELPVLAAHTGHERIRIGYFSQDFRNHPVAVLTAELFELHDRSRFELTAFSFAPASRDEMQQRLRPAFDRFLDLSDTPIVTSHSLPGVSRPISPSTWRGSRATAASRSSPGAPRRCRLAGWAISARWPRSTSTI